MRHAGEQLTLSAPIGMCRDMAAEAKRLADSDPTPARRAKYLDLARQWSELADEMERAMAALEAEDLLAHRLKRPPHRCDALSDRLEAITDASDISS